MAQDEQVIIETIEVVAVEVPGVSRVTPDILARRPRKVSAGMWGPMEIAALFLGTLAMVGAIVLYTLFVVPSDRELERNLSESDRLAAERMSAQSKYGDITSTETQIDKLLTSVDDFETRFLPPATNGRSVLYQRINGLIAAHGLTNTTGPDYQPLETADQNVGNESDEERGRAKYRSLFPGIYVTMTVEGSYQELRRFIRDIETGNEFVIISTIEIEPSDSETEKKPANQGRPPADSATGGMPGAENGQPQVSAAAKPKGKTHGEVVALHLEMAAYFRRANYAPMTEKSVSQ